MKIINLFEGCIGITIFRWFRFKIELWICPPNYEIREHVHPNIDSEIVPIFFGSNVYIFRNNKYSSRQFHLSWRSGFLRSFSIRSTDYHYFKNNCNHRFIFLNFEIYKKHTPVTSAAVDIKIEQLKQHLVCH